MVETVGAFGQFAIGQGTEVVTYVLTAGAGSFSVADTGDTSIVTDATFTLAATTGVFAMADTGMTNLIASSIPVVVAVTPAAFVVQGRAAGIQGTYSLALADGYTLGSAAAPALAYNLTVSFTTSQTMSYAFFPGASVTERVIVTQGQTAISVYGLTLADVAKLTEAFQGGFPMSISETVTVHDMQSYMIAWLVAEKLVLHDGPNADTCYGMLMADTMLMNDGLYNFFAGTIVETLRLMDGNMLSYFACASVIDPVLLTDAFIRSFYLHACVADGVEFEDADILTMIYSGEALAEGIELFAGYAEPSGGFTTWAINTRTNAVTEYQNYVFNSFAKMGSKYIAASSTGLYELEGNDDVGENIKSLVRSGMFQAGGSKFTSFKAAYIGARIHDDAPDILLRLIADDDTVYTYAVKVRNMKTSRVDFGKGLRHRYYAWELEVPAAEFDLDSVEFLPLVMQRRI